VPHRLRSPRLVLMLAYLAFISLGLPDGLIGVGWPSIRATYDVPTEAVGLLLTAGTAGYLTSSVAAGFGLARLGVGRLLALSTSLTALALAGYAAAPGLAIMTCAALVLGAGGGAIDAGLNTYAAGAFGARHMNWLHAFFGLGVTIGPLIMTAAVGAAGTWRLGYVAVALAQVALAIGFAASVRAWRPAPDAATPADVEAVAAVPVRATLSLPAVWLGMAAFALYVAIEIGAGLWAFLLLTEDRGLGTTAAGLCVSGYWGCLFVGRIIQGFLVEHLGSRRVLLGSLAGLLAGSVLVALPAPAWVAVLGLAVLGLAAAAVFPLMTLTTADRVGAAHTARAIGLQIGAAGLGGALIPAALGVLISRTGVAALGPALLVLATALLALHQRGGRRRAPDGGDAAGQFGPVRPVVDGR
jgi:fucose permease